MSQRDPAPPRSLRAFVEGTMAAMDAEIVDTFSPGTWSLLADELEPLEVAELSKVQSSPPLESIFYRQHVELKDKKWDETPYEEVLSDYVEDFNIEGVKTKITLAYCPIENIVYSEGRFPLEVVDADHYCEQEDLYRRANYSKNIIKPGSKSIWRVSSADPYKVQEALEGCFDLSEIVDLQDEEQYPRETDRKLVVGYSNPNVRQTKKV